MRIADRLDGTDHSAFLRAWVATARLRLVDPATGLLISSFRLDGARRDGPEGSSIWMSAHCLQLVDPVFAREQFERARQELTRSVLGFGYAREWPRAAILPLLEASPSSSGLAVMGAAAFGDDLLLRRLLTSLDLAGFPVEADGALHYSVSNQVGDAVLLYALVLGPLWQTALRGR